MKILSFTSLFPNSSNTRHGIFVKNRLVKIMEYYEFNISLISPIPATPFLPAKLNPYRKQSSIAELEQVEGIQVHHPRYTHVPLIGMYFQPWFMYRSALKLIQKNPEIVKDVKIIDAHYAYPDGVAAVMLARKLSLPSVVTVRGSDVNKLPEYLVPRLWLKWAFKRCDWLIPVSKSLSKKIESIHSKCINKMTVIENGVDTRIFNASSASVNNQIERKAQKLLLSVGNLIALKGHHLIIEAIKADETFQLIIIGSGPMESQLLKQIEDLGMGHRVSIKRNIPQNELAAIYAQADLLILASESEGCPNVLLESQACGTPVISTDVGAARNLIIENKTGLIMLRTPESIYKTIQKACSMDLNIDLNEFKEFHSWQPKVKQIESLFRLIGDNTDGR
jgi:glycosyltransferase involved in cell wall biosynthesis